MKIQFISFYILVTTVGFTQIEPSQAAPLGLSHLNSDSTAPAKGNSEKSKFEADNLDIGGIVGASKSRRGRQDVLILQGEAAYARPLRAKKNEFGFVSFGALASLGTVIEVAGAKIGITESAAVRGYASIMIKSGGSDWVPTQLSVPFETYDGKRLATLPVLTIRLDPEAAEFDVYASSRLLTEGVPLEARTTDRKFRLTAGSEGAWLMGLVQSDINPLYVDENQNGVDDDYELASNGKLLAPDATKKQRKDLIKAWRKTERLAPPPALFVSRPRSD